METSKNEIAAVNNLFIIGNRAKNVYCKERSQSNE